MYVCNEVDAVFEFHLSSVLSLTSTLRRFVTTSVFFLFFFLIPKLSLAFIRFNTKNPVRMGCILKLGTIVEELVFSFVD